jgi:hypothetical protein
MAKPTYTLRAEPGRFVLRGSKTGLTHVIKGGGSMKGSELEFLPGVDLTKPIAEQVIRETRSTSDKKD